MLQATLTKRSKRPLDRLSDLSAVVGPTALTLLTVVIVAWGVIAAFVGPQVSFSTWPTGVISTVDADGPARDRLLVGEQILSLNDTSVVQIEDIVDQLVVGTPLKILVRGLDGVVREEIIPVLEPSPVGIAERLSIPFIAAVFLLTGSFVQALTRSSARSSLAGTLFFAFTSLVSIFLTVTGMVPVGVDSRAALALYFISGFFLGVVAVHFHTVFPRRVVHYTFVRAVLRVAYPIISVASVSIAVAYVFDPNWLDAQSPAIGRVLDIYLAVSAIAVILALVLPVFRFPKAEDRSLRWIVIASGVTGALPVFLLSYVPAFFAPQFYVGVAVSTLPMAFVPVGYAYAILRFRLIELDNHVSRAIGFQIALFLMAVVLGVALGGLRALGMASDGPAFLLTMIGITTATALAFDPTRRRVQATVDRLFERPYVAFRDTMREVDRTLSSTPDATLWARSLCDQFSNALAIQPVALFYRQGRIFKVAVHDPSKTLANLPTELDSASPLLTYLEKQTSPDEAPTVRSGLASTALPEAEQRWLTCPALSLWWPIHSHGTLHAVLVFGPKKTGFSAEDVEIVALVSHQLGTALENAEFARELEQLSRASLQARDDERRRISRDLHDHIVQPLIGLNYALGSIREIPVADEARTQLKDLINHVRRISADLRPPALDEVGLPAAARSLSRTVAREASLVIDFAVVPGEQIEVPEPLASTFYSALREALSNIRKHAQATRVSVLLEGRPDELTLVVHDDGVGFAPPARLGLLAPDGHFGLLGMQERMAALGGSLNLHTQPGNGTRLEFRAPLPLNGSPS